jgi:hypothetical protein
LSTLQRRLKVEPQALGPPVLDFEESPFRIRKLEVKKMTPDAKIQAAVDLIATELKGEFATFVKSYNPEGRPLRVVRKTWQVQRGNFIEGRGKVEASFQDPSWGGLARLQANLWLDEQELLRLEIWFSGCGLMEAAPVNARGLELDDLPELLTKGFAKLTGWLTEAL